MISFNKKRNTLEQETYHYELQDVTNPNLFRDIFPYVEPPKVPFNHRLVPMDPPEEIWITDTTFRDGQQSRPPFTVKQIVDLYTMLHRLGGPNGVIRMTEFFLYTDKNKRALEACLGTPAALRRVWAAFSAPSRRRWPCWASSWCARSATASSRFRLGIFLSPILRLAVPLVRDD